MPIAHGQVAASVNYLSATTDGEETVAGGVIAHWDIPALFHPMRDDTPVFTVAQPIGEPSVRVPGVENSGDG